MSATNIGVQTDFHWDVGFGSVHLLATMVQAYSIDVELGRSMRAVRFEPPQITEKLVLLSCARGNWNTSTPSMVTAGAVVDRRCCFMHGAPYARIAGSNPADTACLSPHIRRSGRGRPAMSQTNWVAPWSRTLSRVVRVSRSGLVPEDEGQAVSRAVCSAGGSAVFGGDGP